MQQGPYSTLYLLIQQALQANNIDDAIEDMQYCAHTDAQPVYDLIFSPLFKGKYHFLKDIKTLHPRLWSAFLNNDELCAEIGAKKLSKILKKVILIVQKLQMELPFDPTLTDLFNIYQGILRLIATHDDLLECLADNPGLLKMDKKEFILSQLKIIPDIDEDILALYEQNAEEADEYLVMSSDDESSDTFDSSEAKEPTFEDLQDPNTRRHFPFADYLRACYKDEKMKQFIVFNQDDFLLSLDPASLHKYVFSAAIFSHPEKIVILKVLIATLECGNTQRQERAHNCLNYLLSNSTAVRNCFTQNLWPGLNTSALLLLSVCNMAALSPQASTSDQMLEVMEACFVPLGRAMKDGLARSNVRGINHFFTDKHNLDRLSTLYSLCTDKQCLNRWNSFFQLNNATGDYQPLRKALSKHFPNYLYRKALSHLTLGKNDTVNLKSAIPFLSAALACQYTPAHLALAAVYARLQDHGKMKPALMAFLSSLVEDQPLPNTASNTYRFLFEVYYTVLRHIPSELDEFKAQFNRVYPGLVDCFAESMSKPLMVRKPRILGNDLRDPMIMLRHRLHSLRITATLATPPLEEPLAPHVALLFTEQAPELVLQDPTYGEDKPRDNALSCRKQ